MWKIHWANLSAFKSTASLPLIKYLSLNNKHHALAKAPQKYYHKNLIELKP